MPPKAGPERTHTLLLVEPSWAEHPRDCARFERLARSLGDDGWEVGISVDPARRRSAAAEVVVRLLEQVPRTALDSLETILAGHLRESLPRRHNDHGRIVIYGPTDQVLRICEVTRGLTERSTRRSGSTGTSTVSSRTSSTR